MPSPRRARAAHDHRSVHVAIVDRRIADRLCRGEKTIESRLYRNPRPPVGRVAPGDLIYFKVVAGPCVCCRRVSAVREFHGLTPAKVLRLKREFGAAVAAGEQYWRQRRSSSICVLMWLEQADFRRPPRLPRQYGTAWVVWRQE